MDLPMILIGIGLLVLGGVIVKISDNVDQKNQWFEWIGLYRIAMFFIGFGLIFVIVFGIDLFSHK
jgi:hypothetical protein